MKFSIEWILSLVSIAFLLDWRRWYVIGLRVSRHFLSYSEVNVESNNNSSFSRAWCRVRKFGLCAPIATP